MGDSFWQAQSKKTPKNCVNHPETSQDIEFFKFGTKKYELEKLKKENYLTNEVVKMLCKTQDES